MPRVGVDIGGTFTDIVFLASTGERFTRKVPSIVDNDSRAITEGIAAVLADLGETGKSILELLTSGTFRGCRYHTSLACAPRGKAWLGDAAGCLLLSHSCTRPARAGTHFRTIGTIRFDYVS